MITNTINLKGNILGVPNQTKVLKKKTPTQLDSNSWEFFKLANAWEVFRNSLKDLQTVYGPRVRSKIKVMSPSFIPDNSVTLSLCFLLFKTGI